MVKDTVKRRTKRKAYGVIFNCLSTRAVYIDLVEGYGTKEFLEAFRRNNREIEDLCVSGNCTILWIYNKSANAPWQNGCTKALIKSI